jgi:uncharacterized membrane protein HdeD (DUF308 family)
MSGTVLERRRTGGDVVVGVLLVLAAGYVFGNVVLATKLSVLVLGWTALISGVATVVGALARSRTGPALSFAVGGVLLAVLGLFLLRNVVAGALALTLVAGALLLAIGLTRVVGALGVPEARLLLLLSGAVSAGLGVFVLLNVATATVTLLGTLLGVQLLLDGLTLLAAGRLRPAAAPAAAARAGAIEHPSPA